MFCNEILCVNYSPPLRRGFNFLKGLLKVPPLDKPPLLFLLFPPLQKCPILLPPTRKKGCQRSMKLLQYNRYL